MRTWTALALAAATACAPKAPPVAELPVLVDGRVPSTGGASGTTVPNRGLRAPTPTVPWLSCTPSAQGTLLEVKVTHAGDLDDTDAACVDGDRRVDVRLVERAQWSKDLAAVRSVRADAPNAFAAPKATMLSMTVDVEGRADSVPGKDRGGGTNLRCEPMSHTADRVKLTFFVPKRPAEASCVVEPNRGEPYTLRFRFEPLGG